MAMILLTVGQSASLQSSDVPPKIWDLSTVPYEVMGQGRWETILCGTGRRSESHQTNSAHAGCSDSSTRTRERPQIWVRTTVATFPLLPGPHNKGELLGHSLPEAAGSEM